jgi:hypothetical protein
MAFFGSGDVPPLPYLRRLPEGNQVRLPCSAGALEGSGQSLCGGRISGGDQSGTQGLGLFGKGLGPHLLFHSR